MNNDFFEQPEDNDKGILSKPKELLFLIPRKLRIVSCIIGFTILAVMLLKAFKPEAQKRPVPETVVRVEVIEAKAQSYPIVVTANGTIEAQTRGNLVAQIRGEIVRMADNFKTGGSFEKGDVLIQIDPRDYQAELSRAAASLSQADAAYRQEKANAKQAEEDWKRLGNTEAAPDLVRRKPQLAAAKAQLDSAKAAHETALLNLSRTKITAPYSGRIIRRDAVLGQYVGVGVPIAEVYSTEGVEVRLPISQDEFSQLGLDQFDPDSEQEQEFGVTLNSTVGGQEYTWQAKITRTDSTFDINTRQIDVIAEVINPFTSDNMKKDAQSSRKPELRIGQFVNASIHGRIVEDVFVIPNKSIREGSYSYVVREGILEKQAIEILWQDDKNALIKSGIKQNELVVTTSLNSTLAGAKARLPEDFSVSQASENASKMSSDSSDENEKAVEAAGQPDSQAEGSVESNESVPAPSSVSQ